MRRGSPALVGGFGNRCPWIGLVKWQRALQLVDFGLESEGPDKTREAADE